VAIRTWRLWLVLAVVLAGALPARAVEFAPCPDFEPGDHAICGTVTVLEDRTKPDGRTIDLHVVLLRAASPDVGAPLFLLAGGPGQGATDLAELALGPFAPVLEARDIVLVDQRGTGRSNRLDCPNGSDTDPRKAFGHLFDPEQIAACRKQVSTYADVRLYGTLNVVEDLEEVCDRLGYEHVVLWGGSGGTRTAQVWLREHPDRIEAVALDGVVPLDFRAPSGYARWSQDALDRVFEDCDAQASCKAAYPDLRGDFQKLLTLFDRGPVETFVTTKDGKRVSVPMHRGDFGYAVRGILYGSAGIAKLPRMIHEAARTQDVSAFAQLHWQRDSGLRRFVAMGVHLSVFGTEDVPFIDRASIPELTNGTFLGTYLIDEYTAACEAWRGRGTLPAGFHDPVRSNVPVLLLSGAYDPSTPPQVAAEVARTLPNSRHIVVRNEAHGAGFGCARRLVVQFLVTGSLEGLGPACEDVGPIQFEVPETGSQ
jgi:pimeloyl-ACP methyl ester carboxylesterase